MVYDETKPGFHRLRLDTSSPSHPARSLSSSPFVSSPQDIQQRQTYLDPSHQTEYGVYASHVSSELSTDDLLGTLYQEEDSQGRHEHGDGQRHEHGRYQQEEASLNNPKPSIYSQYSSATDVRDVNNRDRGNSVSFSSHATLDDGIRHSLGDPLPKNSVSRRRTRGASITGSSQGDGYAPDTPGSAASPRINPFTGEVIRRRTRRTDLLPRLDRIESAQDQDPNTPSLASGSMESPYTEPISTPLSRSMTGSMFLYPSAMQSPAISPTLSNEAWSLSGRESVKSRNQSRHASLRNNSRRSSRMSASSPASAFLSKWGQDSLASLAPDPDDEGQAIGLRNELVIGRQIGYGGFSVVKELHGLSEQGEKVTRTVKIVRKNIPNVSESENDKQQQNVEHEIDIWRYLRNEYILSLHAVYDTEFATFCVMDLVAGGTLFDLVRKTRTTAKKGLGASLVKHYAYQLASALRYLHEDIRLVHRDIKLENCLLDLSTLNAEKDGGKLLLCDFGLADFISGDMYDSLESLDLDRQDYVGDDEEAGDAKSFNDTASQTAANLIGTLQYAAPENFSPSRRRRRNLRPALDIWAFGVCVFAMLTGDMPFRHSLQPRVIEMIVAGQWDREAVRKALSTSTATDASEEYTEQVLDVLDGCLEVDPQLRWTISDVLSSEWFCELVEQADGDTMAAGGGGGGDDDGDGDGWDMVSRPSH